MHSFYLRANYWETAWGMQSNQLERNEYAQKETNINSDLRENPQNHGKTMEEEKNFIVVEALLWKYEHKTFLKSLSCKQRKIGGIYMLKP